MVSLRLKTNNLLRIFREMSTVAQEYAAKMKMQKDKNRAQVQKSAQEHLRMQNQAQVQKSAQEHLRMPKENAQPYTNGSMPNANAQPYTNGSMPKENAVGGRRKTKNRKTKSRKTKNRKTKSRK